MTQLLTEKKNLEPKSCILCPKEGDYVICLLKEDSVEWPDNIPLVKHFVGQIISIRGKTFSLDSRNGFLLAIKTVPYVQC